MPLCAKCLSDKPSDNFSHDALAMGMFSICLICEAEVRQQKQLQSKPISRAESQRRWRLKSKYHLTVDQFNKILDDQNQCCAICCTDEPGGNGYWQIDFSNNVVRGLLCQKCNIEVSGWIKHDLEMAKRLFEYLQPHE